MKINYVTSLDKTFASYRYRMKIPSEAFEHEFSQKPVEADIHVFSKAFFPEELEMIRSCQHSVLDVCDDWFGTKRDKAIRDCIEAADAITCPTELLAQRIEKETGRTPTVIEDPVEYHRLSVKSLKKPNCLWFGNHLSRDLLDVSKIPYPLEIITQTDRGRAGRIKYTPWSEAAMRHGLDRANIVLLPSRIATKSPNRLLEAVWAGCHVIASPVYEEFSEWITITHDIPEALKTLNDEPEKIIQCQNYIAQRYSPQAVSRKWQTLFASILAAETNTLMAG